MFAFEQEEAKRLPAYVQDVETAVCVFCPYGCDMRVGERVFAYDEKTTFGRRQRERLVEVSAVKLFRSTGRVATLDLKIATPAELVQIAHDSELTVESLMNHRAGAETYDPKRPPVVVYFRPCGEDAGLGFDFLPGQPNHAQSLTA